MERGYDRGRRGFDRGPQEMHTVTCADCGKETHVPFKPDGTRPVYCQECYSEHKDKKEHTERRPTETESLLTPDEANKILDLDEKNIENFIEKADGCAKKFKDIKSSQIRNFYDYVKSIKEFDKVRLHLLKPKIAYAVGRTKVTGVTEEFKEVMEYLINKVNTEKQFKNFVNFFEAIVAYHKIYGGKN